MTAGPVQELRVVIDSSVLVPLMIQREPNTNRLAQLWQEGYLTPLVNDETIEELRRTLLEKSPTPKLAPAYRFVDKCLRYYVPWCEYLPLQVDASAPQCRDPKDQKFVELAVTGKATVLLTRDGDLLSMDEITSFAIMGDRDFLRNLNL